MNEHHAIVELACGHKFIHVFTPEDGPRAVGTLYTCFWHGPQEIVEAGGSGATL